MFTKPNRNSSVNCFSCIARHLFASQPQQQLQPTSTSSSEAGRYILGHGQETYKVAVDRFVKYFDENWINSGRIGSSSGATLAICHKGGPVFHAYFGSHGPDAIYVLVSMTKIIASLAVMQLKERGLVDLDQPVSSYLPSFNAVRRCADGISPIPSHTVTIRHCLNHTAGLTYVFDTVHPQKFMNSIEQSELKHFEALQAPMSAKEFADNYEAKCALLFPPGTHFNYSSSPNVLAAIIETLTGQSFPAYVRANITGPLGMNDTFYQPTEDQKARMISTSCDRFAEHEYFPVNGIADYCPTEEFARGDDGMKGTCDDWLKLNQVFLNGGELNGVRVLSASGIKDMTSNSLPNNAELVAPFALDACTDEHEPHFGLPHHLLFEHRASNSFPGQGWGLGFAVVLDGQRAGLHRKATGTCWWCGAAGTFFAVNPNTGIGCILLTNNYTHTPRIKAMGEVISFAHANFSD